MSQYLDEIKANANNLEHLLKFLSFPDLSAEEKNLIASSIEECINFKNIEKKVEAVDWKKAVKGIVDNYAAYEAKEHKKIAGIKTLLSDIQWRETQIAYLFEQLVKSAQGL